MSAAADLTGNLAEDDPVVNRPWSLFRPVAPGCLNGSTSSQNDFDALVIVTQRSKETRLLVSC
jgi:hypothetical protein